MRRLAVARLAQQEVIIPDSGPPVRMGRLREDGPLSALVWFPAGWSRPTSGRYAVDELVVVLHGRLTVSGVTVSAGEVMWVPPSATRSASASPEGACCVARFGGAPRWERGRGEDRQPVRGVPGTWATSPLGVPGRAVTLAGGPPVWWLAELPPVPAPTTMEVVAAGGEEWVAADAGEVLPSLSGPCWVMPG